MRHIISMTTIMQSHYDEVDVISYQGDPPSFIWAACENLYHSSFCSEHHLKTYSCIDSHTITWVSRRQGVIDAVIIFKIKNHAVVVLNDLIVLSNIHIINFSDFIFENYHATKCIQFNGIFQNNEKLTIPHLSFNFSEDFILTLPLSSALWLNCLSKKKRTTLRHLLNRAQHKFPNLQFRSASTPELTTFLIQHILSMSRFRLKNKRKKFCMTDAEEKCLIDLIKKNDEIYVLENEGKIIAGLLSTYCKQDLFFHVISHDSNFNEIRAGLLCCYYTILQAIENKYERIHFLWGRYQYKLQLGAKEEKLIKLAIFKNKLDKFIYPSFYFKKIAYQIKLKLKHAYHNLVLK